MDAFISYCLEHWFKLTCLILLLAFTVWLTAIIVKAYYHWTHRIKTSEIECKKIDGHIASVVTINNSLVSLDAKLIILDNKVTPLWQAYFSDRHSPIQLNDKGTEILTTSGINKVVENHYQIIFDNVKSKNPSNAYEGEQFVVSSVNKLKSDLSLKNTIEEGAFSSGVNVDTVLYVGAIFIRDRILKQLGFNIEDIDKHKPNPT